MNEEIHANGSDQGADGVAHWRPHPDVVSQIVEGETVLVHLQTNEIYALNSTASRAWELLVGGRNTSEIHEALQAEFDVPPDQLRDELDALMTDLAEKDLIHPAES